MIMRAINRIEKDTGPRMKIFSPIFNNRGKARASIAGIIVFLLGIGLTLFVIANPMDVGLFEKVKRLVLPSEAETGGLSAGGGEKEILYWYAPMDPTEIYDQAGLSKMGMKLLPKYSEKGGEESGSAIRIDPATVQNIGVLTETVERGDLRVDIRTVGNLDYDEQKIFLVNTKYDGWIEKVYVNYIGEQVRKGAPLFDIYSPDLVTTQEEYLSARRYRDKMKESGFPEAEARAEDLLSSARSRLLYWDITNMQIAQIEEKGEAMRTLTVASPASGVVVQKMDQALEGMRAKSGMNLYKIADLSTLWLHVDIYEYQLPWIKEGQEAEVEISYYPGDVFRGKVLFFYPYLDEKTRTVRACMEIPNPDGRLRPEMFATVMFAPVAAKDAVLVPEMAVLHSGERDVVVLDLGGGRFEPREVKLGLQGGGRYQVLEGLEGGDRIVTSSQFLIDSESNLREAINKMLMAKKAVASSEEMAQGSATKDVERSSGTKMIDQGSAAKDMEHGSDAKGAEHAAHGKKPMVDEPAPIEALQKVIEAYLPIWKALAGDSTEGVEENAKKLAGAAKEAANRVEEKTLKAQLEALEKAASGMKADSLEAAREFMKSLSRATVEIFESHEVKMPDKYTIIECPMLKKRWIQDTEGVLNPFYGSSMPKCGVKVGEFGG